MSPPEAVWAKPLLAAGRRVHRLIQERIRRNLDALHDAARLAPACSVLRVEGGWSAVVRVPATRSEESLVLELLEGDGVLVHPGYFFDFGALFDPMSHHSSIWRTAWLKAGKASPSSGVCSDLPRVRPTPPA